MMYRYAQYKEIDVTVGSDFVLSFDDADKVSEYAVDAMKWAVKNELIFKDPEPTVVVKEHAESSITLLLITWCSSSDYWTAYYAMQESVKLAFDREGINIPFNQLDVHVINE